MKQGGQLPRDWNVLPYRQGMLVPPTVLDSLQSRRSREYLDPQHTQGLMWLWGSPEGNRIGSSGTIINMLLLLNLVLNQAARVRPQGPPQKGIPQSQNSMHTGAIFQSCEQTSSISKQLFAQARIRKGGEDIEIYQKSTLTAMPGRSPSYFSIQDFLSAGPN